MSSISRKGRQLH